MALSIYKTSPACYKLLSRLCRLPSTAMLRNLLNRIPFKSGINKHMFTTLKNIVDSQKPEENLCVLMFDEVSIRNNLSYNGKFDIIDGYQDHDKQGGSAQIASKALVFMITGIKKKWKQPIAYYFSGSSVSAYRLSALIKEILHECFLVGLKVVTTCCDLDGTNIKALDILGSSMEEPYFTFEGHKIVTILDPPHLLKCMRNLFMSYDVKYQTEYCPEGRNGTGIAKWSYVQQFYEVDSNNPNYALAPALSKHHIHLNSKQKMKVKLAAQVFSHTVSTSILAKIGTNELPADVLTTALFLGDMDKLFDTLNADTPDLRRGKLYSTNLKSTSIHLDYLKKIKERIQNIQFIGIRHKPPSQDGWIRTINAVTRLWGNLKNDFKFKSLSTRRLNQDPLENTFGCLRFYCGSNPNPTVQQFVAALKTSIINHLNQNSKKKNCEDDQLLLLDNLKSFLFAQKPESECKENIQEIHLATNVLDLACNTIEQGMSEAQACTYVAGYILKREKINCNMCKTALLAQDKDPLLHMFTEFREYNADKSSLTYASKDYVKCVETCTYFINNYLKTNAYKNDIKKL